MWEKGVFSHFTQEVTVIPGRRNMAEAGQKTFGTTAFRIFFLFKKETKNKTPAVY